MAKKVADVLREMLVLSGRMDELIHTLERNTALVGRNEIV